MQTFDVSLLYQCHLSTWFILPVTGYKKTDFDPHFINTYLSKDCTAVIVKTSAIVPDLKLNCLVNEDNTVLYAIRIPDVFKEDVQKYVEGKYTGFSDKLKGVILAHSTLPYCVDLCTGDLTEVDLRMAAILENHKYLVEEALAEALYSEQDREEGLEYIKQSIELLRPPDPKEFL